MKFQGPSTEFSRKHGSPDPALLNVKLWVSDREGFRLSKYWDAKRKCGVMVRLIPTIKKFCCVPATSVSSEQLFSKAGELISVKRNWLGKKNIDMLLFLNKNL